MRPWQQHGCADPPFLSTELLVVEVGKDAPRLGPWERVRVGMLHVRLARSLRTAFPSPTLAGSYT